jgi:hypothetical protein
MYLILLTAQVIERYILMIFKFFVFLSVEPVYGYFYFMKNVQNLWTEPVRSTFQFFYLSVISSEKI